LVAVFALMLASAGAHSAYAFTPPAPEDVPPLEEGAQECVRTSLVENYASVDLDHFRNVDAWTLKGPGASKKRPGRKLWLNFHDSAGNPGNWDMSCVGYLDASPTTDVWLERRRKGSKKRRKIRSNIKTVETPINLLRTGPLKRSITLKLNYKPMPSRDDWVLKTKECADPVGGEIKCRTRTWKFRRLTSLGPVT
jgi:hypothetical protein